MFWKRKDKTKDGHDAGDSAAETPQETAAETEAAGTGAGGAETAGEADAQDTAADTDATAAGEKDAQDTAEEEVEEEVVGTTEPDADGVQRVRTAGVLKVDGEEIDVISNTWIVDADDDGVIVIDPAHDAKAVLEAVGEREIYLVACTNAYNTHIDAAIEVAERDESPIALHPREMRAWRKIHGAEHRPEIEVEGEGTLNVGDLTVDVLALPGTSSGSVGYYIGERGVVFSGDTLRRGEPGTVGNGYLDYTTQLASVGEVLLSLPPDTRVLPDRGPSTTVAKESENFDSWVSG